MVNTGIKSHGNPEVGGNPSISNPRSSEMLNTKDSNPKYSQKAKLFKT